jgi:hypothetical protein
MAPDSTLHKVKISKRLLQQENTNINAIEEQWLLLSSGLRLGFALRADHHNVPAGEARQRFLFDYVG